MRTAMSAGIVVLITCLLLETTLRALDYSYYWALSRSPDPILGYRPLADIHAWQRQEGEALIRTNAAGWRLDDRETAANALRLLILGDSMTEGVQLPVELTYWYQLPDLIKKRCPDTPISVVVIASGGYGPGHYQAIAEADFLGLKPDWVIYTHFPGNDVMEASPTLVRDKLRPFPNQSASASVDRRFSDHPEYRHKQAWYGQVWLAAVQQLRFLQAGVAIYHRIAFAGSNQAEAAYVLEPQVDGRAFMPPPSAPWADAWARVESAIVRTRDLSRESGAQFDLISLSTGLQVTRQAEVRQQRMQLARLPHLFHQENVLSRLSEERNIAYLALAPALQQRAAEQDLDFHGFDNAIPGFGHWNRSGHAAAADLMADHLCRRFASLDQ